MVRAVWLLLLGLGVVLAVMTARTAPMVAPEVLGRTAPIYALGQRIGQNLRAALSALSDRRDWRSEALRLRAEKRALEQRVIQLELENARLRRVLKVRETQAPAVVAVAPVIAEDPSGLFRRLVLGLGAEAGLEPGMPVTSAEGLVGVILEVTPKTAVVRTLVDPESAVGVRPEKAPGRGIAYGRPPDRLRVRFPREVRVQEGDLLVTGAIGGLFPEGIPVGRVVQVEPPGPGELLYWAWARPEVRFSLLEEVVVLRRL